MRFSVSSFWLTVLCFNLVWIKPVLAIPSLDTPIQVSNQSPMARIFGLPEAESAELLKAEQQVLGVSLDIANNFTHNTEGLERIWLDGESAVTTVRWRYGTQSWQWGLDLPYVYQSGGALDSTIFQWHELMGLSQADREKVPRNDFNYIYDNSRGERLLSERDINHGVGDLRFNAAYPLMQNEQRAFALRGELKLPTGDSDYLHGSGGIDLGLAINALDRHWLAVINSTLHAGLGVLWTQQGDVLSEQRKQWIAYSNLALVYRHSESLALKLQIDAHSPFYHSDFDELGAAVQASLGASFCFADRWVLDLALVEDIAVDSASDVVFHFYLKRGFGG